MTNIPKKLSARYYGAVDFSWLKKYKDEMVPNAEAHEEVINKINELIDYLESKQTTHVCDCSKKDENKSKGECSKCGVEYPIHKGNCPELYPPEHEEWIGDFEETFGVLEENLGHKVIYANEKIKDYIRDNFVSKEKIKREIEENTLYVNPSVIDKPGLLESLGLGD